MTTTTTTPAVPTVFHADLAIKRGDTTRYSVPVTRLPSGGLAEYEKIQLTAKHDRDDADADAVIQHSLADGGISISVAGNLTSDGILVLTFFPNDTAALPGHEVQLSYDVQLIDTSVSPADVHTILEGTLIVAADVTQATS